MADATNNQTSGDLHRLVEIMALLRSAEGCPWDREQTHTSLKPCVVEETYEVIEAIDLGNADKLCEELGDLLLQVVFHAQLASEAGQFTIDDVIRSIVAKLIRRHPHVFAGAEVSGVAGVLNTWEQVKKSELGRDERPSALDGVPKDLPALLQAEKLQHKAAKVGFDWGNLVGPLAKTKEEFGEFEELLTPGQQPAVGSETGERLAEEFGDILFSLVNVGRFLQINPELALRKTSAKFVKRFHFMEQEAKNAGKTLTEMNLAEMDELWEKAK